MSSSRRLPVADPFIFLFDEKRNKDLVVLFVQKVKNGTDATFNNRFIWVGGMTYKRIISSIFVP
ncbi:hypothetical protein ACFO6W_03710 [Dysgonomonas termitidis]|uniref:Uncharacterized protein n=1 Tax=Dysgonomonas termitidis TaxID=1516126 RepID=A0ABV9KT82_9BACT